VTAFAAGLAVVQDRPRSCLVSRWRVAADHGGRRVLFVLACEGRVSPVCGGRSGLTSTHSAGPPGGGRHDHVFGDRAAQSEDRARPLAGSCHIGELTRGLVTLWGCGVADPSGGDHRGQAGTRSRSGPLSGPRSCWPPWRWRCPAPHGGLPRPTPKRAPARPAGHRPGPPGGRGRAAAGYRRGPGWRTCAALPARRCCWPGMWR
jgi:hypothetical protein